MSSSSSSKLSLTSILCDKELGKLLREWHAKPGMPTSSSSTRPTPIPEDLPQRLEKLVDGLPILRVRDPSTDEEEGEEESVAHVRAVIQGLLQRVIDHDPINSEKYQRLMQKTRPSPPPQQQQQQQLQPVVPLLGGGAESSNQHQHKVDSVRELSFADFESTFETLSVVEFVCLLLFYLFPEDFVVNKTEVFYFLRYMDISWMRQFCQFEATNQFEVTNILTKLEAEGLISRQSPNNGFSYYYFLLPTIRSWLIYKYPDIKTHPTLHGIHICDYTNLSVVININNKLLNSHTTFNLIPSEPKLMLHLGSWRRRQSTEHSNNHHTYNRDDYIVVDQESLHNAFLKRRWKIYILSLRGTSGIVHFPDSVSNQPRLQFLDLSACNNLESLPKEIGLLEDLEYLDLSECYLLEHIPIEITSLYNLKVLKGFIINNSDPHLVRRTNTRKWCKKVVASSSPSSSCPFSELIHLEQLEKLTIRTQRMSFPTNQDLHTLCNLPLLHTLGITWVGNPNTAQIEDNLREFEFPISVKKLELQNAPHRTTSLLLELISKRKQYSCLNKLYIRGGWFQNFSPEKHCFPRVSIVRLRYLRDLEGKWNEFRLSFPNLTRLEVFQCPKLVSFPCDSNGIWRK